MSGKFLSLLLCSLLCCAARPMQAVPVQLNRQVLLEDGRPAIAAKVDLWIFDGSTTNVKEHRTVRLPADGWLRAEIDVPTSPSDSVIDDHMGRRAIYNRHYMVIDAPGAPIIIVRIPERTSRSETEYRPVGWDTPITLTRGNKVVGSTRSGGKPVSGAKVSVMWLNGFLLNSLDGKVSNAALQTTAGKDGKFAIRPFRLLHDGHSFDEPTPLCTLVARATVGGEALVGSVGEVSPVPPAVAPIPRHNPVISLGGTWTARGRVLEEESGKPVSGARVEMATYSAWPLSAAITNVRGEWEIGNIPPNFQMAVAATHPTHSVGSAKVGERLSRIDDAARKPRIFNHVEIRVRSLATVEGQVEDEATGQAPISVFPHRTVGNQVLVRYSWGEKIGNDNVGGGLVRADIAADGRFSLAVPAGEQVLGLNVPGYEPVERSTVTIPATGLKNVVLKVRKRPAFFVRLAHPRLRELKGLSVDVVESTSGSASLENGLWRKSAKNWGETLKIRVLQRSGKDVTVLLETEVAARPEHWPQIITLPGE